MTLSPKAASEELGPSRPSSMTARTSWKRPLRKGLPAIPLKTKWEDHMWFKNHGKAEGPWATFADAVEAFLAKEAEENKGKSTAT